jgi:hypothetical protein
MGIIQLYPPDEFYEPVEAREFKPGQFCWIPTPHIGQIPLILDIERSSPEEHEKGNFIIRNARPDKDFHKRDRTLPIKHLNLKSHEELLVRRARKRPGIILSSEVDRVPLIDRLLRQKGKTHLQEDSLFIIPGYSIEREPGETGFPQEMVARIRCLLYRQFFYFPTKAPHLSEGIARFDRIQVVVGRDPAAIKPMDISLSKDVFTLFLALFLYCISGQESDELQATKEIAREAYQDS